MAERDAQGRFVKGNSVARGNRGGPGRPPKKREERYYQILVATVSFADWRAIVKKAAEQALGGDPTARKWLADYIVGVPEQQINISGEFPSIREVLFQGPDETQEPVDEE